MNIGLDMMGGDFAPLEAVKGLQEFLADNHFTATIHCIGDAAVLTSLLAAHGISLDSIHIVHAANVTARRGEVDPAAVGRPALQGLGPII
jgi:glycerol-3-phosphate acyltransferase PlsX